jgi:hypothetical protein
MNTKNEIREIKKLCKSALLTQHKNHLPILKIKLIHRIENIPNDNELVQWRKKQLLTLISKL